jgi:hypothetical protein
MRALKRTVIVLVIVALAVIVVAVGLPWFVHTRTTSAVNVCMNNLRQLDGAKNQWALEGGKTTNDTPSWEEIWPYLGVVELIEPCLPVRKVAHTFWGGLENIRVVRLVARDTLWNK